MTALFYRRTLRLVMILLASTCLFVPVSQAQDARRELPLEPVDVSKITEVTPERLAQRIRELVETSKLYQEACDRLENSFDGTSEQANRIAMLKLKMLERSVLANIVSAGAIENFRCAIYLDKSTNSANEKALQATLAELERGVASLGKEVKLKGDQLVGSPATMQLLAKKLERQRDLLADQKNLRVYQQNIALALAQLDRLDVAIESNQALLREEVLSQGDSINRNRLSKQSRVLNENASKLIETLGVLTKALGLTRGAKTRAVEPGTVFPKLPAIDPKLSPATEELLRKHLGTAN